MADQQQELLAALNAAYGTPRNEERRAQRNDVAGVLAKAVEDPKVLEYAHKGVELDRRGEDVMQALRQRYNGSIISVRKDLSVAVKTDDGELTLDPSKNTLVKELQGIKRSAADIHDGLRGRMVDHAIGVDDKTDRTLLNAATNGVLDLERRGDLDKYRKAQPQAAITTQPVEQFASTMPKSTDAARDPSRGNLGGLSPQGTAGSGGSRSLG